MTFSHDASVGGAPTPGRTGTSESALQPQHDGLVRPLPTEQNIVNDFLIDRDAAAPEQGANGYTGISGIAMQDAAMTGSMGPIYDRSPGASRDHRRDGHPRAAPAPRGRDGAHDATA